MINYLGKFVPNLFKNAENLRKLLEKDTEWYFDKNHKEAIDNFKLLVISPPVLKFYNPLLPITVSCDTSEKGLAALLEQKENERWHPIAHASRTLNKSEKNYCQLEKEIFSIVSTCTKFHDYVYGKPFHVCNDHLPLKSIFTKSIVKSPPRIQRFLLRLQKYNFEMYYMQGSLLPVADTLSRATLTDYQTEVNENELNCFVHSVISNYLISESRL